MSNVTATGLFEKDSQVFYASSGVYIVEDPQDNKVKIFYTEEAKNKVLRAIKLTHMAPVGEAVRKNGYYQQELRRRSDG